MKIIFLDFDGVITTPASCGCLSAPKMQLVKKIVDATGAKIVISSSWRRRDVESTLEEITDSGNPFVNDTPFLMPEAVVGITDRMYAFRFGDAAKHYRVYRGVEILRYLDEHPEVENYVILDDDADMLLPQKDHFIQTDGVEGITEEDAERAIRILNGEEKN